MSPLIERFISRVLSGYGPKREKLAGLAREELMARLHARTDAPGQEEALSSACEALEQLRPLRPKTRTATSLLFYLSPFLVVLAVAWWFLPDDYIDRNDEALPEWLRSSQLPRVAARRASMVLQPLPEIWGQAAPDVPVVPPHKPDPTSPLDLQREATKDDPKPAIDWRNAWRQADPENSWYLLRQAEYVARKAMNDRDSANRGLPSKARRVPLDPAAIQQVLLLCEEAARLPHYIDQMETAYRRHYACIRRANTQNEAIFQDRLRTATTGWLMRLRTILLDQLLEKDRAGDTGGVVHLEKLIRRIAVLACAQPGASGDEWTASTSVFYPESITATLAKRKLAAAVPALDDFTTRYLAVRKRTYPDVSLYIEEQYQKTFDEGLAKHRFPVVPPERDGYRWYRLLLFTDADQPFAYRTALGSGIVLLVVGAFIGMAGRTSPMVRGAATLARLHSSTARARVLCYGLLLPVGYWLFIVVATPFGFRDLYPTTIDTPREISGGVWMLQMLSGLLLVLTATLFIARRESARRFGFLGLRRPHLLTGWLPLGLAYLVPVLIGVGRYLSTHELQSQYETAVAGVLGIVATAALFRIGMPLLHFRSAALGTALTARLVLPNLWALSIAAVLAIPVLKSYEKQWVSEKPPMYGIHQLQWYHDHTQEFREAIRREFADEPAYTGE